VKAFLICAADAIEGEKPRTEGYPGHPWAGQCLLSVLQI
jgi:hypothetical protein